MLKFLLDEKVNTSTYSKMFTDTVGHLALRMQFVLFANHQSTAVPDPYILIESGTF